MTFFFETYGCQMNKAESASIEQLLIKRGWSVAHKAETADLIIINTCSVRATAESRVEGRLGWYTALRKARGEQSPFILSVTGCMAERLQADLKRRFPVVDYVVGNFEKNIFTNIAAAAEKNSAGSAPMQNMRQPEQAQVLKQVAYAQRRFSSNSFVHSDKNQNKASLDFPDTPVYTFAPLSLEPGAFQAFVPIMHGCNNFCTYCIVPHVRGREISRSPQAILDELDILAAQNVREITLLGQNVNSYNWKNGANAELCDFPLLMEKIASHIDTTGSSIKWVRFMSSHPKDLSDRLIEVIRRWSFICRHIHLPVQHGSNDILRRMNRRYTREHYLDLVERIRQALPGVSLTTDILIGFPGETESDFEQTLSLMEQVRYETAFMYYYNPREGTPACAFPDQIPLKIKKERLARIIEIQQRITKEQIAKRVGKTVSVLVESVSRDNDQELLGHTERDERVVFPADKKMIGQFVDVHIDELHGNTFRGKIKKSE